MKKILLGENIVKSFGEGVEKRNVLDGISVEINEGEFVSVMGPSGSGKSTLMYALSGMDDVDSGKVLFDGRELSTLKENELVGTPVSSGSVRGQVKVLRTHDEKPILPGDILVTKAPAPGWTTLFINAGGVLRESGGMLQHGASVAREMGKPCIVGIQDITKILKNDQVLHMDGATGVIKIIK